MKKKIGLILVILVLFSLGACGPKSERISVKRAKDLVDEGEIKDGIRMLEDIIEEDDEEYDAWEALVEAYVEDEEYEDAADALEDFREVLAENYEEDDRDIEKAIKTYDDLVEDVLAEDESLEVTYSDIWLLDHIQETNEIESQVESETISETSVTTTGTTTTSTTSSSTTTTTTSASQTSSNVEDEEILADSDNFLTVNDYLYIFQEDGSLIVEANMAYEDFEYQFNVDSSLPTQVIEEEVSYYLDGLEGEALLISVTKYESGIDVTILYFDAASMIYIEEVQKYTSDWYEGDYDLLAGSEAFVDVTTGQRVSGKELEDKKNQLMVSVNGSFDIAYVQLPGPISYVNEDFEYMMLEDNFITIYDGGVGFIVFDYVFEE